MKIEDIKNTIEKYGYVYNEFNNTLIKISEDSMIILGDSNVNKPLITFQLTIFNAYENLPNLIEAVEKANKEIFLEE